MQRLHCSVAATMLAAVTTLQTSAQLRQPAQGGLKVGDAAPEFTVKDVEGKRAVTLSDLKGKPVVLLFGSCT
jgi:cytochrome oxidase Cu insertion factor (SCO1/SenC/PrrC family)